MQKKTIGQKINTASSKVSDTDISNATLDLAHLKKLIKAKKKEQPDLSIPDIISEIEASYREIAFRPVATRTDFSMLRALKHLQKNPSMILDTIDTSNRSLFVSGKRTSTYTPDLKESIPELLKEACSIILSSYDRNAHVKFVKGEFTPKEREDLQRSILAVLKHVQKIKEKQIIDSYTLVITEIAQFLDAQGCFEKGTINYNQRMRMLGLSEMQEQPTGKKGKCKTVDHMSGWKDPKLVGNLPLETLIMSCAFFTNRLCKEYKQFKLSVFLMSELNPSEDTILGNNNVTHEEFSSTLVKYEFLQAEARKLYDKLQQQRTTSSSTTITPVAYELDYEPQEYSDYNAIFSSMLPSHANDLTTDFDAFMQFNSLMEILYDKKDMALDSLIMFLLDDKSNVNWGYIEEEIDDRNSIERKGSNVLLGFDLGKFNTPIRLHTSLHALKKLIAQTTGSDIFPVYAGNEDWSLKDQFGSPTNMTTQVFRMFTKPERKQLKQKALTLSPQDRLYGFIGHLNWLANGITPPKYQKRTVVHLNTGQIEELGDFQR